MKAHKGLSFLVLLFMVMVITACAGNGLQLTGNSPSPQYKMTTPIAPGVAVPDKIETSIGTLKLIDGYPDDATTQKIYDNLDAS
ncbi:MAG: hypothetical protein WAM61_10615 [Desulfobacterales bacterium]